jgi:hypothetical protein
MTADEIGIILSKSNYSNLFIPEFTWGDLRIDAIMIDTKHRWVRGFEIKINKQDFIKDNKWVEYSKFCSSLCVVCPEGVIQPEDIEKPFGLIWITKQSYNRIKYKKKPINFQKRNSLSWLYTYTRVLETEFRRIYFEIESLKYNPKILQKEIE